MICWEYYEEQITCFKVILDALGPSEVTRSLDVEPNVINLRKEQMHFCLWEGCELLLVEGKLRLFVKVAAIYIHVPL